MLVATWFRIFCLAIKIKIYITLILPVVLNECETWSLAVREEHRLRVCENLALRKIFGPKTEEARGGQREMHYEGSYELCSQPNIY
jgi:hypothetical protein